MLNSTMKGIIDGSIELRVYHRSFPDTTNFKLLLVYLNGKTKWILMEEQIFNLVFYLMELYQNEKYRNIIDNLIPLIRSANFLQLRQKDSEIRRMMTVKVKYFFEKNGDDAKKLDYDWLRGFPV